MKERKRKFIVNIDEFNKVYDYFQELTKSDITLEKNKVCYYYLDDEDNLYLLKIYSLNKGLIFIT